MNSTTMKMTVRACQHFAVALALALALASVHGCAAGGEAFSTRFPDNRPEHVERLFAAMAHPQVRDEGRVAVGATTEPRGLFAYDLQSNRVLWQQATELTGSPVLAGHQVIVQDHDHIVGRSLLTGKTTFSIPANNMRLIGATGKGPDTALVLSSGSGSFAQSRVIYLNGSELRWQHALQYQAGAPAMAGTAVLIPWGNQFLSGLHRDTGEELSRLRVGDGVLAQAFLRNGRIFIGSEEGGSFVTPALANGKIRDEHYLAAPKEPLPGHPPFLRNVYRKDEDLAPDSARHRIQLTWSPTVNAAGGTAPENDTVYLTFYRFVFAFEYPSLRLRWIHTHESDVVGARAVAGGLLTADQSGGFSWLNAGNGAVVRHDAHGQNVTMVAFPWDAQWTPSGTVDTPDADTLRTQLFRTAQDPDTRLVPARRMAVKLLAALPDPKATTHLLTLCEARDTAPAIQQVACDALSSRSPGTADIFQSLQRHHDYLTDTTAPPVAALAKAAQEQKQSEAFDALVEHLWDPHTRASALTPILHSLQSLAPDRAGTPIASFARTYHADGVDEHVVSAVKEALTLLATRGDEEALATLDRVAKDPLSLRGIQERARTLIGEYERAAFVARQNAKQAAQAKQANAAGEAPAEAAGNQAPEVRAKRLTLRKLKDTLLPVRRQLRACLTAEGRNLFRARVIVIVEDNAPKVISVNPKSIQRCVEPLVRSQPFPETETSTRQQLTYVLKRR